MLTERCIMTVMQIVWLGTQAVTGYAEEAVGRSGLLIMPEIVADFLSMDAEEFENQYDRNELYNRGILYCSRCAWKYDGEAVDGFQEPEDYHDIDDITAIRFINLYSSDMDVYGEDYDFETEQEEEKLVLQYFGDYAVSIYSFRGSGTQSGEKVNIAEFSYIKAELSKGDNKEAAPEALYEFLEKEYYEVQEEIRSGEWEVSPEKKKAVYISNGALPKHPSQIYVRFQEKVPDLIFRNTWQYFFAGWIDEDHFICYNDAGPVLIHLETEHIEAVKKEEDDYDAWGCHYELKGNQMIAIFSDEEYYRWDIIRENGDIYLESRDGI